MSDSQVILNPDAVCIDVRSPGEYACGHIPGAFNIPLLDDEARRVVGITYKEKGQEAAVIEGFKQSGQLFASMIEKAQTLSAGKPIQLYCWRGGLRSKTMTWLFNLAGLPVERIPGGYKAYRKTVQDFFHQPLRLRILGGYTGSGKTEILNALRLYGAQVIDLEELAAHRGSAFGAIGMPSQPTVEHFENMLVDQLKKFDRNKPVWLEDESRKIGTVVIHVGFWQQKDRAPLYRLDIPLQDRVARIRREYAHFGNEMLAHSAQKIGKRLGPQHLKASLEALETGDIDSFIREMLVYYDKTYAWSNERRAGREIIPIDGTGKSINQIVQELLKHNN